MASTETATPLVGDLSATAPRKIARRLLPFLFLLYITSFIDRVNVGFAGLQMTRDLHFSNEVFGFGAGTSSSATACSRSPEPYSRKLGAPANGLPPS